MQTRNGNVAAMDKRVDLGSLFCMIGRHGPAVAVAVMAVVSVLAGLIIYRNVKGKRRKAADGDAGGVPDCTSLRYQESNPSESCGRSTDVSKEDLSNSEEAHLPEIHCSIRNRRTVCHKETLLHHPTEKVSAHEEMHTSTLSQRFRSMMEPSLQDSDKTLKDDWMTADVASCGHVEDELRPSKPMIGGPHQDQSEVPKSQEDEILEMFVWDAETSQEKVLSPMTTTSSSVSDTGTGHCQNIEKSQETDQMLHDAKTSRESDLKELACDADVVNSCHQRSTENVALSGTDLYPSFEEQTNAENTLFDGDKIAGEIRKDASNTSGTCLSMQHINGREQNVMDQFGEGEILTIELKQGGIKKVENGENTGAVKANNGKTEISIREATMDTEWMVDDEEAHPWVNLSDHIVVKHVQTNHRCCSSLSEIELSSDNEVKQTNTLYFVGGNGEKSNKVVAVQPMSQFVDVTFHIHYVTQSLYQKVAITGNQQELGNWKGFVPLEKTKDGHWATVVSLPAESHVEWKFVVVDKGEVCRWEECGNRLLETGSGDDLLIQKWWGFL